MTDLGFDVFRINKQEDENICVVRLSTSMWDKNGAFYVQRCVKTLKRKSKQFGMDLIHEECSNVGAYDFHSLIINLDETPDGIYILKHVNISRDYESGHVDGYDFKLIPYEGE